MNEEQLKELLQGFREIAVSGSKPLPRINPGRLFRGELADLPLTRNCVELFLNGCWTWTHCLRAIAHQARDGQTHLLSLPEVAPFMSGWLSVIQGRRAEHGVLPGESSDMYEVRLLALAVLELEQYKLTLDAVEEFVAARPTPIQVTTEQLKRWGIDPEQIRSIDSHGSGQ